MATSPNGIKFSIVKWQAWYPGIDLGQTWPGVPSKNAIPMESAPAVRELPARIRRRLEGLARVVACLAMTCLSDQPPTPLVFASRHGSLQRTVALLSALARGELMSPAAFSLSVHNSIVSVLSIVRGDHSPTTAIAAGAESLGAAMLEAVGQLHESARQVLVLYADEPVCEPYRDPLDYPEAPFGLALLLRSAAEEKTDVALRWQNAHAAHGALPRQLLAFLNAESNTAALGIGHAHWTLKRLSQA